MRCIKLVQGLFAVCLINICTAEILAISASAEQPLAQTVSQNSNQLTEEGIREILAQIRAAGEKEDLEEVLKFVAPFAYSEVIVESEGGTLTTNLYGKEEHRALLAAIYPKIGNRRNLSERMEIRISPDGELGMAVISRIREYTTENGQRFFSEDVNTIRFALVNNQPMVVSTTLRGWLAERPLLTPQPSSSKPQS